MVLSSHIYSAELARDDVVNNMCAAGSVITTAPSGCERACAALKNWTSPTPRSKGGHVWREFWRRRAQTRMP